jgi:hypothetical protein
LATLSQAAAELLDDKSDRQVAPLLANVYGVSGSRRRTLFREVLELAIRVLVEQGVAPNYFVDGPQPRRHREPSKAGSRRQRFEQLGRAETSPNRNGGRVSR